MGLKSSPTPWGGWSYSQLKSDQNGIEIRKTLGKLSTEWLLKSDQNGIEIEKKKREREKKRKELKSDQNGIEIDVGEVMVVCLPG